MSHRTIISVRRNRYTRKPLAPEFYTRPRPRTAQPQQPAAAQARPLPPRVEIAIRLKDGGVLCSRVPFDTHCLFASRERLDPRLIESAGYVRGGDYFPARSSAIGDYIRLAKPPAAAAPGQEARS